MERILDTLEDIADQNDLHTDREEGNTKGRKRTKAPRFDPKAASWRSRIRRAQSISKKRTPSR
jgi:hypothetical protein